MTLAQAQEPVQIQEREVSEHQLSRRHMIHFKGYSPTHGFQAVLLEVIVDPAGNIESVKAIRGPEELFGQAEALEAKRKFKPFLREGNPVRASFPDYVSVVPPEKWAETNIPFPEIKDWSTLKMRLERTVCFGSCAAYSVEVNGDRSVDFNGTSFVLVNGRHRATLSKQVVESLLAAFRQANYFSLLDSYRWAATDLPTYTTSIEFDGQKKSVRDYAGSQVGMPDAVEDLEQAFDSIAGTEKWIKGNRETAAALVAENWGFKADSDENRTLFANAVSSGNSDLIQSFIGKGAPALSMTKDGQGAVISAAAKGNFDLVKLMLANQSNPPSDVLTCALGAAAGSGNLELTRFLLDKGGQPDGPACGQFEKTTVLMNAVMSQKDRQEETPIFYACQNQHPEAIRLLSAAGADMNAKDRNGETALMSCFGNAGLKALIDAGADLTIKDPRGQTAAEAARSMGARDKAELLETAMKQRKAQ